MKIVGLERTQSSSTRKGKTNSPKKEGTFKISSNWFQLTNAKVCIDVHGTRLLGFCFPCKCEVKFLSILTKTLGLKRFHD